MAEKIDYTLLASAIDEMGSRDPKFLNRYSHQNQKISIDTGEATKPTRYTFGTLRGFLDQDEMPTNVSKAAEFLIEQARLFHSSSILEMLEENNGEQT